MRSFGHIPRPNSRRSIPQLGATAKSIRTIPLSGKYDSACKGQLSICETFPKPPAPDNFSFRLTEYQLPNTKYQLPATLVQNAFTKFFPGICRIFPFSSSSNSAAKISDDDTSGS